MMRAHMYLDGFLFSYHLARVFAVLRCWDYFNDREHRCSWSHDVANKLMLFDVVDGPSCLRQKE